MPRYETQFEQFGISGGQRQQSSELVLASGAAAAFSPEARKGRLFICAEAAHTSTRERDACQLVLRTLRKTFYGDTSYSVTSSLKKAIDKANAALYQQNFNTAEQKRVFVGVTCAVVKEQSLYVAQVYPAQAYLLAENKLRSLPPNPSWAGADMLAGPKPNALGASLTIEPTFYRAAPRPGDTLLACSSSFTPHLRREVVEYLLRVGDPAAIADELATLSNGYEQTQAHGFVLGFNSVQTAVSETTPQTSRGGRATGGAIERITGQITGLFTGSDTAKQAQKQSLRRSHSERERQQLDAMPEEPPPRPREELRVRPVDLGESLEERVAQVRDERVSRLGRLPARSEEHELTPSSFLGEGDYIVPQSEQPTDLGDAVPKETFTSYARRSRGQTPDLDPTLGERLVEPFHRVAVAARNVQRGQRMRRQAPVSAMPPKRKNAGLSYRKEGPSFPWIQLALLVLIVVLLVVVGYNQLESNSRQQQVEVLAEARQAVAALRSVPDEASALQLLEQADVALDSVRNSGAISESQQLRQEFLGLQREFERVQSAVQRVSYFDELTEVGQHPQANAGLTFETIVVPPPATSITNTAGFESIYGLDGNTGTVYQMPKTGGEMTPLLSPGQAIANGIQVGRVRAIAWRFDNIVAVGEIDNGYVYYFRNGGEWNSSNLGGSTEWRSDISNLRLATYQGNLYFWGALPSQILKYTSGQPGDLYTPWIGEYGASDIESALDLAIDGQIYLLRPDGRVQVFSAGAFTGERPAPKVDPAISAATSFVVTGETPESGYFFFLDPTFGRIVQADKQTGELIQQIRVRPGGPVTLDALTTMLVDESGAQPIIYLVNHGKILRSPVPQPPRPFQPGPTPVAEPTAQP